LITISTGNFSCADAGKSNTRTLLRTTMPRSIVEGRSDERLTESVNWELVLRVATLILTPSDNEMFAGFSEYCMSTLVAVVFTNTGMGGTYTMLTLLI
jgi:hypothetical protein